MAMETSQSFTARRQATQALPPFQLPSTNQDIPNYTHSFTMAGDVHESVVGSSLLFLRSLQRAPLSKYRQLRSNIAFRSSQSSHYYSQHGAWPTPQSSSYALSSGTPQAIQQSPYGSSRASTYEQQSPLPYSRTSQSPATGGEGLPGPSYGQGHQFSQAAYSQAGSTPVSLPSQASQTAQTAILGSQTPVSTQPPTPGALSSNVDSYAQSRPSIAPSYYASSAPQQSGFPGFQSHTSPTAPSPTTSAGPGRGLASMPHPSGMAPPQPYGRYAYGVPPMGGPIMSNLNTPGHQMSLVSGMGVGYPHHMGPSMYGHGHGSQANAQTERPFKCDQCPQSFNRNHDLKRHKRIHLAVKPFPCNFCDKSFSRKDALKRHRLVKGCGNKDGENASTDNNRRSPGDHSDDGTPTSVKREA
ncbi:C2H2 finger domain-containing protein [Colletotrichum chrysophilum]|uniref:C2H2 finger domain-containing protein n=1 Tax=Colletotrichum chrysophilum TaxID=1836956 RepID=A0AAD9AIW9_9PEZI|nr:C2H2 finger domain-containing protein [Colletotrichum chrysophilum]